MSIERRERCAKVTDAARRLLEAGDAAGAAKRAAAAVQIDPGDAWARTVHAEALLATGESGAALAALNAADWYDAADTKRNTPDALLAERLTLRATAWLRQGNAVAARRWLLEATKLNASDRHIARKLAALQIEADDASRAAAQLRELMARHGEDAATWRLVAEAHEAAGEPAAAIEAYDKIAAFAEAMHFDTLTHTLRLARLHRRAGRFADAMALYRKLLAESHDAAGIAREAGELAVEIGDDAAAKSYFQQAIDAEPDEPSAPFELAQQHTRCGRLEKAVPLWRRLLERDESGERARAAAGLIMSAAGVGRHRFADRMLERLRAWTKPGERVRLLAEAWRESVPGRLLRDMRDNHDTSERLDALEALLRDASDTLQRAAADRPDHADLHYHFAVCQSALGQEGVADASLDRALRLNAGYLAAARRRLRGLIERRHLAAAHALLDVVLARKPDTRDLLDVQIALDLTAGRFDQAVRRLGASPLDRPAMTRIAASVDAMLQAMSSVHRPKWRRVCQRRWGLSFDEPWAKAA